MVSSRVLVCLEFSCVFCVFSLSNLSNFLLISSRILVYLETCSENDIPVSQSPFIINNGNTINKNNNIEHIIVPISTKMKAVKPSINSAAIDAPNNIAIGANPKTINIIDTILIISNEFVGIFSN